MTFSGGNNLLNSSVINSGSQIQNFGGQNQNRSPTPLSYTFLKNTSEMEADEIKSEMIAIGDNLIERINLTKLDGGSPAYFARILSKISTPQESGELSNKILSSFMESQFFPNLRAFTVTNQYRTAPNKQQYLLDVMSVLSTLIDRFPSRINLLPISEVIMECRLYIARAPTSQQQALREAEASLSDKQMTSMLEQMNIRGAEEEEKKKARKGKNLQIDNSYQTMPSEDFTLCDVIPGIRQLQVKTAIRKMPETGNMINSHNYYDIVFRLLNEDAICDLRNGVTLMSSQEYLKLSKPELRKRIHDSQIKHHEQLSLSGLEVIEGSSCLQFRLMTNKKRFVDWKICKKLLPGSLVVLSPDNFKTIFVGLIKNNDASLMNMTHKKFGFVPVNIEVLKTNTELGSITQLFLHFKSSSFQMIESGAYFEAYKHVLLQLQVMDTWSELPLEKYIVRGDPENMRTPRYMEEIIRENQSQIAQMIQVMNLDESQLFALNRTLSSELAMIQGPPGTGKTYIGVQIVKILLEFKRYWKLQGPILLVTYTNHALNQFLTYIKEFTSSIIRIGRKTDDGLDEFNLWEKSKSQKSNKAYFNIKNQITATQERINDSRNLLASYQAGYLNSFIKTNENATTILTHICSEFKSILISYLRPIQGALKNFIQDKIQALVKETDQNIVSLFWLGILDIESFIQNLQEEYYKKSSEVVVEGVEIKDDQNYQDEREMDYKKFRSKNNERMESVFGILIDLFKPTLASKEFRDCHTLQDCISKCSSLVFTENADIQVESLVNRSSYGLSLFRMNFEQKWRLNNTILSTLIKEETDRIEESLTRYKSLFEQKNELDQISNNSLIRSQSIVAMTTTGRAKYAHLLKNITFPIVIVEEAAEVFEAHIVTSLSQGTQHLILIGDHEQLRPNPSVYDLSFTYNLSMSLFERQIKNKIPHSTLDIQRRMRPEISNIMNFIYPNLKNHASVLKSPLIKGVSSNLFFYDHNFPENTNELMQSKFNVQEAEMVVRFAWYLLQQNYLAQNITILTLYTGQLLQIKSIVRRSEVYVEAFKNLRVVNVDNYQGEENDIILLSLVRSNKDNQIGYLKISNRVCVALSRARHGLFIFGNSQCLLGSQLQLWKDVIRYLEENSFIGPEIKLKCLNHEIIASIKNITDFQKVPEGGCTKICEMRMNCGHKCEIFCHPYFSNEQDQTGHNKIICKKPCARDKPCKHPCSFKCFQCKNGCQPCITFLQKEMSPCKHTMVVKCHEFETTTRCMIECEKNLSCGHKCARRCYEDCTQSKCKVSVIRKLSCNHEIDMDCGVNVRDAYCYKTCGTILECGHECKEKCGDCKKNGGHAACKQKCSRVLVCGHQCKEPCTKNCPPCEQQCSTKCIHSKCSSKCKDVCVLCKEPCANACQHSKCTNFCSAPCNRQQCNKRCLKILKCGHQCIGLCGELCPSICRVCNPQDEAFAIFFGNEEELDSLFLQIDCGHIFEVSALDHLMQIDPTSTAVKFKQCPKCRQAIMSCKRYMSQINQVMNDVNAIKRMVLQQENEFKKNCQQAYKNLDKLAEKLRENDMTDSALMAIDQKCKGLRKDIQSAVQLRQFEKAQKLIQDISLVSDVLTLAIVRSRYDALINSSTKGFIDSVLRRVHPLWYLTESFAPEIKEQADVLRRQFMLDEQMQEIINAIGLGRGHWNKCPNGHYYVIGDCGGAMQESKCPDCNAVIGGRDHQLVAGNQHASELGGQSAWDPQGFNARVARGEVNLQDIIHD